jgi:dihydrolipoamide dehydrogenase
VIGGGPGGYVAAIKAAQLGMKVACVEGRGSLGGTCLNVGCIPSKALLQSTHFYEEARHDFKKHGVLVDNVRFDLPQMMKQKADAVSGLTKGIEGLFKKNKVQYVQGWGKLKSGTEVAVALNAGGEKVLKTKNVLLATGSEPTPLPGVPFVDGKIVDSTGALTLDKVPKEMVVIGAGVIGLEMGSVWGRLGAEVTVVEYLDRIVPSLDADIRRAFQRSLEKQGFKFRLGLKVAGAEVKGDTVALSVEPAAGGAKETVEADVVLVAVGRRPFSKGLGLEELGIKTQRGRVVVDSHFRTNVPSVYAIGDLIDGPMLAHKAEEDGVAAVETMLGKPGHVNYETVPGIIYTHPEVATVGRTEEQCKEAGIKVKTGKFSFMANSRARAVENTEGMVKMIADAQTDKILGVHIVGPNAGELIPECVLAMEYGACSEDIARSCHGHPTLSEAVKEAAIATAFGKAIHM